MKCTVRNTKQQEDLNITIHVTDIVTIICSARQKWHEILSRPIPDPINILTG